MSGRTDGDDSLFAMFLVIMSVHTHAHGALEERVLVMRTRLQREQEGSASRIVAARHTNFFLGNVVERMRYPERSSN